MQENYLIQQIAQIKMEELSKNPYVCLIKSDIDINPHQVEAFSKALLALKSGGIVLADEVGLGKTIEAGLVIKHTLLTGGKKVLLIIPSNLRKQWQFELDEKFSINSFILDSKTLEEYQNLIDRNKYRVVICSYNFASRKSDFLSRETWDLIVFDEAHKLRNVHKSNIKNAKRIFKFTKGIPKIMLTATPIQNNLFDLYGILSFIDEKIFLDKQSFASYYIKNKNYEQLKTQIKPVVHRTLRKDVTDYLSFKKRICITIDFKLSPQEAILYKLVSDYLKREIIYAIPSSNRNLITIIIRKLLASSSHAVAQTFEVLKERLVTLLESTRIESVEKSIEYFLDFIDEDYYEDGDTNKSKVELYDREKVNEFIQHEIDLVDNIIKLTTSINKNSKSDALLKALKIAFNKQNDMGIEEKVVIFTESVRTQEYLYNELIKNGYEGQVVLFNGSLTDGFTKEIYKAWRAKNFGQNFSSRAVEIKHAVVDYFRNNGKILLVTDAGSEGLNLQFCNTVINYDLPWNPQKIEQRIGRCHRYGQKNDTVVINLLNTENAAEQRVYEILSKKLMLFDGVFGASDDALGLLESGFDFEKRILRIYQQCNTVGEFNKEFKALEKEFERKRNKKFHQLKSLLTDDDDHSIVLKKQMNEILKYLDDYNRWSKIKKIREKPEYPQMFEMNIDKNNSLNIKEGYILIGAFYDNLEFLQPVFSIIDNSAGMFKVDEDRLIELLYDYDNAEFKEIVINHEELDGYIDDLYKDLLIEHHSKFQSIIQRNDAKIDNWAELRKIQFNLKLESINKEIEEINYKAALSKNFKEKIALKKEVEKKEEERQKLLMKYHQFLEAIDKEASMLKDEFQKQFDINPIVFLKAIVKYRTEEEYD